MALSNKLGLMLLTTGNKSEMAVGYATLYGDMCGGYNVLKDIYKVDVFAVCRWRNANAPVRRAGRDPIPERILTKPPSAELRPNQTDQDSLPPYEDLDAILHGLVEEEATLDEIVARGYDAATVERVQRLLYGSEYKRRQAPPGVKIGGTAFGRDRRYPIVNGFRDEGSGRLGSAVCDQRDGVPASRPAWRAGPAGRFGRCVHRRPACREFGRHQARCDELLEEVEEGPQKPSGS